MKYNDTGPGVVVQFFPTLSNSCVNIHGGKLRRAELVYRTFVRDEPNLPLVQYQFKSKNGNALDLKVENIAISPIATAKTKIKQEQL